MVQQHRKDMETNWKVMVKEICMFLKSMEKQQLQLLTGVG